MTIVSEIAFYCVYKIDGVFVTKDVTQSFVFSSHKTANIPKIGKKAIETIIEFNSNQK